MIIIRQKEFNSKAAKETNAKFFELKGKEALREAVKKGKSASAENFAESLTSRENAINRNIINSKIDKLRKSWLNTDPDHTNYEKKLRKLLKMLKSLKLGMEKNQEVRYLGSWELKKRNLLLEMFLETLEEML